MEFDLNRFKQAQDREFDGYATALKEIKNGYKSSHWIWYIFPQLKGLGRSFNSDFYGLDGLDEAKAYYADAELRRRLDEISEALLAHKEMSINNIMGWGDSRKLKSCMTLFDLVAPNSIFADVLDQYFASQRDAKTIAMCGDKTSKRRFA